MANHSAMVSVDFWDTLVDAKIGGKKRREIRQRALFKISEEYVTNLPPAEIEAASKEASDEFNRMWFNEQRTPKAEELVAKILNNLGIPATKYELDFLVEQFEESLLESPPAVLDGARDAIRALSEKYQLTLISDTMYSPGRVIRKLLKEEELIDYFDAFLFSDEAGFSKPNPKAFLNMLEDTGCKAGQSYHIGDRLNTDIFGAKSVGMKAILFTGVSDKSKNPEEDETPDHVCKSWEEIEALLL